MENSLPIILFVTTFFPLWLLTILTPILTRRTESFGVTIPEDQFHSIELKTIRKRYMWIAGMGGGFILLSFLFLTQLQLFTIEISFNLTLFLYLLIVLLLYIHYHYQVKRIKEERKWFQGKREKQVIDLTFHKQSLTVSNLWYTIPFFIALITLGMTLFNYQQIPDPLPMQYNFAGEVTRWVDKSYASVLLLPIMQIYLTTLLYFLTRAISHSKQQLSIKNPKRSAKQNVLFRRAWSGFMVMTAIVINSIFFLTQLPYVVSFPLHWSTGISLALTGLLLITATVLAIKTGQGGSRIPVADHQEINEQGAVTKDDDAYWKLGQIYFNPEDPSFFVEKRFGIGWTVNMASPWAWMGLLLVFLLSVGLPFLLVGF